MKRIIIALLYVVFMYSLFAGNVSYSTASANELTILSETENNDTFIAATLLLFNRQYTGTIESYDSSTFNPSSSSDYYTFTLPADGNIIVSIKNKAGKNWYVDILTPDRLFNTIYSNNFSMETVAPRTEGNKVEVGLPAGTYYVRMSGYNDTTDKPYRFMISDQGIEGLSVLNEIPVYIDGERQSFDQAPFIKNGTTLVPMRAIFEKLGASVVWNSKDKVVTAKKDNTEIVLTIDSTEATINEKKLHLRSRPKLDVVRRWFHCASLVKLWGHVLSGFPSLVQYMLVPINLSDLSLIQMKYNN